MTPTTETVPASVNAATRAFGTPLRVELLRHFLAHPGPQATAVVALGESSANVSRNSQVLIESGVVTVTAGGTHGARCYAVDPARVTFLTGVLLGHILGT